MHNHRTKSHGIEARHTRKPSGRAFGLCVVKYWGTCRQSLMLQEDLHKPKYNSLKRQSSVEAVFPEKSAIQDRGTEMKKGKQVNRNSLGCPSWSRKCGRDIERKRPAKSCYCAVSNQSVTRPWLSVYTHGYSGIIYDQGVRYVSSTHPMASPYFTFCPCTTFHFQPPSFVPASHPSSKLLR